MKEIFFIAAGFAAGVAAGMGMGGGTLLIPALTLLLGVPQHAAQGVNVMAFLPAAAAALFIHAKAGRLRLRECLPVIAAGAVGALALSFLAGSISAPWLRRLFGIFLLGLALCRAVSKKRSR